MQVAFAGLSCLMTALTRLPSGEPLRQEILRTPTHVLYLLHHSESGRIVGAVLHGNPILVALEAEFRAATTALSAADAAVGEVYGPYNEPPMPSALLIQRGDTWEHSIPRPGMMPLTNGGFEALPYGRRQVEELRGRRHMVNAPGLGDPRPNLRAQARGDEIVAAAAR